MKAFDEERYNTGVKTASIDDLPDIVSGKPSVQDNFGEFITFFDENAIKNSPDVESKLIFVLQIIFFFKNSINTLFAILRFTNICY